MATFFATTVAIIGAAYLMSTYQRVAFGEVSEFLKGLGHHLTDINRIELVTLAPLVALTRSLRLSPA